MISYGDRPNDYDSVSKCKSNPNPSSPPNILFQISETNSVLCINRILQIENESYIVSISLVVGPFVDKTLLVHLTAVTDTRKTHTIISSGALSPHSCSSMSHVFYPV